MNSDKNMPQLDNVPETTMLKLMERVDNARDSFLKASTKYSNFPTDGTLRFFEATAHDNEYAVRKTIDYIVGNDQDTVEQKRLMISTLLNEDSKLRIEHFTNIVGDMGFIKIRINSDFLEIYLDDAEDDDDLDFDEPTDEIMEMYMHHSEMDIDVFVRAIMDGKNAKNLKLAKQIGAQALEIVKVAAAAGLAAWLVSRKYRKN